MSLIHTCELNGANPFDYLTELQRHARRVIPASIRNRVISFVETGRFDA